MKMRQTRIAVHAMCVLGLLVVGRGQAAPQATSDQATIQQLQKQVDDLNNELSRLKSATDPAAQNQAMQQHWTMMQDYMRSGMMGSGMMGPRMMMGPGMMGSGWWMMGHGMGMGPGMGWAVPPGMTPNAYQQQMSKHMQTMRSQMAAIAAETDPAKREKLIREHYDTMYRDMQTMRGMGWMWAPNAAASLPDAGSQGAKLESQYCSQCHAPPSPSLHTAKEWSDVTTRMRAHIGDAQATGSTVKIPSAAELDSITAYLGKHGRTGD